MSEEWRDVAGFEGRYRASSAGRLQSVRSGRILKGSPNGHGYLTVWLTATRGRSRGYYVHRVVCAAFHGPPASPELVVNHLNGQKLDCRPQNLCWCTRSENNAHARQLGLHKGACGTRNARARLTDAVVAEMRRRARSGASYTQLAARFGVAVATAYRAVVGRTWKHVS